MKSLTAFLVTTAISVSAFADNSLSVKAWALKLENSLKSGSAAEVTRQLDLTKIENDVLALRDVKERQTMTRARAAYKAGRLKEAIDLYNKIPKGSDYWLEAVEEKGWAYLRLNDTERALAQTKTLLNPTFLPIIGSEPFLLQTISQLKVCDYKEILKTNKTFKDTQKNRLIEVQNLADTGTSEAFNKVIAKVDQFPISFVDVGEESKLLPRLFYRDRDLQKNLLRVKMAEVGIPVLQKSLANGTKYRTIAQKAMARLEANARNAKAALPVRMKNLAQAEVNESFDIIQRLNLIEVETIQRVHTDQSLDPNRYSKQKFSKTSADQLVFPDDGHPWIDELDKYQLELNACPTHVRRKI